MSDLTPKQSAFVREYIVDRNATQAAIRAGYSPRTAEVQGSRLLRNAKVSEAVAVLEAEAQERTQITSDDVRVALWREAHTGDLAEPSGARVAALDKLAKILGMYESKVNVRIEEDEAARVRRDALARLSVLTDQLRSGGSTPN